MLVYFGLLFTNLNTAYHVYEAVSNNGGTLHTDKIIRLFTEFIQACMYVVKNNNNNHKKGNTENTNEIERLNEQGFCTDVQVYIIHATR